MARHDLISGAVAAILVLSSAPGYAGCRADANCISQPIVIPQFMSVPPIVQQQIATMTAPLGLSTQDDASEAADSGAAGPGGPFSLADLDSGIDEWLYIAPHAGFDALPDGRLTNVAKIEPAREARPAPPKAVTEIAPHLLVELPVNVRSTTVPGIAAVASESGNRALWFPQDGN